MKVHRILSDDGNLFAFEIDNAYIRLQKIAALLDAVDNVSNLRLRKPFSSSSDVHIEFEYCGEDYMVWEPYGDSSRYWIGPREERETVDINALVEVFEQYQPPMVERIIGNIITLRFSSLFSSS